MQSNSQTNARNILILGNWKLHGGLSFNASLVQGILAGLNVQTRACVGVCVPAPYLPQLQSLVQGSRLVHGAQDCAAYAKGAYTGDVAATMLAEFGVQYVLVGHSERRQYQQESSHLVALKAQQALAAGVTPVVCVGETLQEREAEQTLTVLTAQLQAVLAVLGATQMAQCVIAYEPVWAIGTGITASPEQAQAVHCALREWLVAQGVAAQEMQILYGGSMKPDNAAQLLSQADIDGGLIGGAALKAEDFLAIVNAAN